MELIFILTLLNLPNVGNQTLRSIINLEEHAPKNKNDLFPIIESLKKKRPKIGIINELDIDMAYEKSDKILKKSEKDKVKIIKYYDKEYPKRLLSIDDFPVLLHTKGNIDNLNKFKSIAIVGTRNPTQHSKGFSKNFGSFFSQKGFLIVSGLALGCDTEAHKGCLKVGGKTIAVLAQGLGESEIMPRRNIKLVKEILENDGCLISEYPLGQKPSKAYYIRRNRIQSGLSETTIIIETDEKGGTMHTAKFCLKQKRILACLKPPKEGYLNSFKGNKILIEENHAFVLENLIDAESLLNKVKFNVEEQNQQLSF